MNTFEPGCYLGSHHGHYNIPEVIRFANRAGRPMDAEMAATLARYDAHSHEKGYPMEAVTEESDSAIEWLNEHHGMDDYSWEWNDGDFGLYPDEEET